MNQPLNKNCPVCGGYVYLMHGKQICSACRYVIPGSTQAATLSDYSNKSISSAEKYCWNCNTKMEPFGDGSLWECPNCHYGCMDYIGDPPVDNFFIPCDNVWGVDRIAVGKLDDLMSNTLQFDRCERIIFRDKTLDFVFEIPDERYKDIDTIIVNGHKFVRDKNDLEC